MVEGRKITRGSAEHLAIPDVTRLAAVLIVCLILYGGLRTLFLSWQLPLIWPILAAFLSVALLLSVNRVADPVVGLARLGFHLGLFAYFLSLPIVFPETIEPGLPNWVHHTIGAMLVLCILGFEAGYKAKEVLRRRRKVKTGPTSNLRPKQRLLVGLLIFIGLAAWFLTTVDYSLAANVSIWDILLSMRGRIDGGIENPVTQLGIWSYLLTGGLYLATAAAFVLLHDKTKTTPLTTMACWSVIALCAALGFLSGSRALFLFSFAPLALALWVKLSTLHLRKAVRSLAVVAAGMVVIGVWLAMTSMRGQDVRAYEGSWEEPFEAARGAFDIYTSSALIIQSFPDEIDYEYGRSLVPLVLGWFPRSMWPNKPYPFSIFANKIRGETLEDRAASIAVGLPGEGYGNFGLPGVFIWGFLMGMACRLADDYLKIFNRSDPLRLLLGTSMCIWAAMIVRGGVPEMFYMGLQATIFPIALSIALKAIERRRARAFKLRHDRPLKQQQLPV
jgi:oligosaccharide repeat unit polymerase